MNVKRLDFLEYAQRIGYGWYLVITIPILSAVGLANYFVLPYLVAFIIVLAIIFYFNVRLEYAEYLKFMDIVTSDDCDLYIQKIKASGQVAGYDIGTDCSIAIKKGMMYWFNYDILRSRGTRGLLYCLELNTNISWKITSRGNVQIKANYYDGLGTFNTFNIFNHISEVVKYLPENLKIDS